MARRAWPGGPAGRRLMRQVRVPGRNVRPRCARTRWSPAGGRRRKRRGAGLGRARRSVRPADLVHLPQVPPGADAGDAGQRVWWQLVEHLDTVRDPAALPGWLAAPARRGCARVRRAARRAHAAGHALDAQIIPDHQARPAEQWLLAAERHAALREAFARLPPCCQRLITVLIQDRSCHTPRSAPGCRWRPWASSGACPRRRQAQLLRAGGLGVCRLPGLGWRWHWGEGSIVAPGAWKWPAGVVPAVCPGLGRLRPAAAPAASPPQRVARRSARRRNRGASLASCSV